MSGHVGAINITVAGSHSYVQFQVSAVIEVDDTEIEGKRSAVTDESTVFVPVSGMFFQLIAKSKLIIDVNF